MIFHKPKIPAWIEAEIDILKRYVEFNNINKLRERRARPNGVYVDIFHHVTGLDVYLCDLRNRYFTMKELCEEANKKVTHDYPQFPAAYLYTAIIEPTETDLTKILTQLNIKPK